MPRNKKTRYIGRFQIGDHLPLYLQCVDSDGVPVAPDAVPTVSIYDTATNERTADLKLPLLDPNRTGQFGTDLLIGSGYAAGHHVAYYDYAHNTGTNGSQIDIFEIIAGGHAQGAISAIEFYSRPQADFIVTATEDGTLEQRRGPYIG